MPRRSDSPSGAGKIYHETQPFSAISCLNHLMQTPTFNYGHFESMAASVDASDVGDVSDWVRSMRSQVVAAKTGFFSEQVVRMVLRERGFSLETIAMEATRLMSLRSSGDSFAIRVMIGLPTAAKTSICRMRLRRSGSSLAVTRPFGTSMTRTSRPT